MNPRSIIVIAIVALLGGLTFDYFGVPTNVITTNRVAMQSPSSALEAPAMDGMALRSNTNTIAPTNSPPVMAPTFADGVIIAVAVLRSNPGFATLLTPQEQVSLCARIWQQQRASQK